LAGRQRDHPRSRIGVTEISGKDSQTVRAVDGAILSTMAEKRASGKSPAAIIDAIEYGVAVAPGGRRYRAAVTMISTLYRGAASFASTVARAGVFPADTQPSHTAFISAKVFMSVR